MLGSGAKPMATSYGQTRIFMDIAGKLRFRPATQCDEGGLKRGCWNKGYTNGKGPTEYTDGEDREGDGISCLMPSPSSPGGYALAKPPSAGAAARGRRITAESVSLGTSSNGSAQQQRQQRAEPSPSPASAAASESAACSREATIRQGQPTISTPQHHTDSISSLPLMQVEVAVRGPKQVDTSSNPSGVPEKKSQPSDQLLDEMFGGPSAQCPQRNNNYNNNSAPMPALSRGSSYVSHVDPVLDTLLGPQPTPKATTNATDFDPFASPNPSRGYPSNNAPTPAPAPALQASAALPVLDHTIKVSGTATQRQWSQAPQQRQQQHVNSIDDIFS